VTEPRAEAGRAPRTYWHGGGRIEGDFVLNGLEVGTSRSGAGGVHVTTERSLAEVYASTVRGTAWVYEVRPVGEVIPVPSLVGGPTISFRCERAQIVRRFTVSNADRAKARRAVGSLR
jgi:hypothetical protein